MKLVQTLVVRDEADIVDAQIAYHLNAGVDFVLATDHDRIDGTTEILESYERDGQSAEDPGRRASAGGATGARNGAARGDGARRRLGDQHRCGRVLGAAQRYVERTFEAVPQRVRSRLGADPALRSPSGRRRFFADRMTARVSAPAPINDPTSPYRPHAKAAHRADPRIAVGFGSHTVFSDWLVAGDRLASGRGLPLPFPHARAVRAEERAACARGQAARPVRARERGAGGRPDRRAFQFPRHRRRDACARRSRRLARRRHASPRCAPRTARRSGGSAPQ